MTSVYFDVVVSRLQGLCMDPELCVKITWSPCVHVRVFLVFLSPPKNMLFVGLAPLTYLEVGLCVHNVLQ